MRFFISTFFVSLTAIIHFPVSASTSHFFSKNYLFINATDSVALMFQPTALSISNFEELNFVLENYVHFKNVQGLRLDGAAFKQSNRILEMVSAFQHLKHIEFQNFSQSQIGENFGYLQGLQSLAFVNCPNLDFNFLVSEIQTVKNLKEIYFEACKIVGFPKALSNLNHLHTFGLTANPEIKTEFLLQQFGQLPVLAKVHLKDNELRQIPSEIGRIKNLRELDLSGNLFSTLPKQLLSLNQLNQFFLHKNPFFSVQYHLGLLSQLTAGLIQVDGAGLSPHDYNTIRQSLVSSEIIFFNENGNSHSQGEGTEFAQLIERLSKNGSSSFQPLVATQLHTNNFEAGQGGAIAVANLVVMHIPPNAFLDKNGELVEGNIQLQFQVFITAEEILITQLPLSIDRFGKKESIFPSPAIHLKATYQGESVFLNPGMGIQVSLKAQLQGKKFRLLSFDAPGQRWLSLGNKELDINPLTRTLAFNIDKLGTWAVGQSFQPDREIQIQPSIFVKGNQTHLQTVISIQPQSNILIEQDSELFQFEERHNNRLIAKFEDGQLGRWQQKEPLPWNNRKVHNRSFEFELIDPKAVSSDSLYSWIRGN